MEAGNAGNAGNFSGIAIAGPVTTALIPTVSPPSPPYPPVCIQGGGAAPEIQPEAAQGDRIGPSEKEYKSLEAA